MFANQTVKSCYYPIYVGWPSIYMYFLFKRWWSSFLMKSTLNYPMRPVAYDPQGVRPWVYMGWLLYQISCLNNVCQGILKAYWCWYLCKWLSCEVIFVNVFYVSDCLVKLYLSMFFLCLSLVRMNRLCLVNKRICTLYSVSSYVATIVRYPS